MYSRLWVVFVILMGIASGVYAQELPTPIIKSPEDGAIITGDSITFEWYIVEGASQYHVQIAVDEEFTMLEVDDNFYGSSDTKSYTWNSPPQDDTRFYWRVRARTSYHFSEWTESRSIISASSSNPEGESIEGETSEGEPAEGEAESVEGENEIEGEQEPSGNFLSIIVAPAYAGEVILNPEMPHDGYATGTKVTLTATPKDGYEFWRWDEQIEGDNLSTTEFSTETPIEIEMTKDRAFLAIFKVEEKSWLDCIGGCNATGKNHIKHFLGDYLLMGLSLVVLLGMRQVKS